MGFTKMMFINFHRLIHAHSMLQSNYYYSLNSYGFGCYGASTPLGGVFEIGFVEQNPLVLDFPELKKTITVSEGDIYIIPPNHRVEVSTQRPGDHRHCSVEFLIDCTTEYLDEPALSPDDLENLPPQTVILPYVIPGVKESDDTVALIRQLARDQMLMVETNYFEQCRAFMQIMDTVVQYVRQGIREGENAIPPSCLRYCQLAKQYISMHIDDHHIAVSDIADYVGINKNYLTNIFTLCEHDRMSNYINRVKLNRLKELVVKYNYSIKSACETVGFYDVNYVSRIFKKYYGITLSEYRKIADNLQLMSSDVESPPSKKTPLDE